MEILNGNPIICYLVEYAAFLLNWFEVGKDGKTSFERCRGKKAKVLRVAKGEAAFWKNRRKKEVL